MCAYSVNVNDINVITTLTPTPNTTGNSTCRSCPTPANPSGNTNANPIGNPANPTTHFTISQHSAPALKYAYSGRASPCHNGYNHVPFDQYSINAHGKSKTPVIPIATTRFKAKVFHCDRRIPIRNK